MLNNSFFHIVDTTSEGDNHHFQVSINAEHSIFEGHFPGQPVVPGVFSLQMIKECLEMAVKKRVCFNIISTCKFYSLIVPSDRLLNVTIQVNNCSIQSSIHQGDEVMLKLKANYQEL